MARLEDLTTGTRATCFTTSVGSAQWTGEQAPAKHPRADSASNSEAAP